MVYKQLLLDSASCYDPNRPSWNLQSPFHVDKFRVLNAQIPNSFFSTNSANNQVAVSVGGTNYYAQLKPGFWTASTIAAELKRALLAANATNGWNVTYNVDTRSLTITGTNAFQVLGNDAGSTAYNQLGAKKVGPMPAAAATSVTLGVADLTGTSAILLTSSQLISRDNLLLGGENVSVLAYIPVSNNPGSVIQWRNPGSWLYYGSDLSYIEMRLLDSATYKELDLNNNSFQLTIGVTTDPDDPVVYV